jgi:hypothetical protein
MPVLTTSSLTATFFIFPPAASSYKRVDKVNFPTQLFFCALV